MIHAQDLIIGSWILVSMKKGEYRWDTVIAVSVATEKHPESAKRSTILLNPNYGGLVITRS